MNITISEIGDNHFTFEYSKWKKEFVLFNLTNKDEYQLFWKLFSAHLLTLIFGLLIQGKIYRFLFGENLGLYSGLYGLFMYVLILVPKTPLYFVTPLHVATMIMFSSLKKAEFDRLSRIFVFLSWFWYACVDVLLDILALSINFDWYIVDPLLLVCFLVLFFTVDIRYTVTKGCALICGLLLFKLRFAIISITNKNFVDCNIYLVVVMSSYLIIIASLICSGGGQRKTIFTENEHYYEGERPVLGPLPPINYSRADSTPSEKGEYQPDPFYTELCLSLI